MRLGFVLAVFMLAAALPSQAVAVSKAEKDALYGEIRRWSLNAASQVMSFDHTNYAERLRVNAGLFTPLGCRGFMRSMLDYGISDGIVERKETITFKDIWKKRVVTDVYNNIGVEEEDQDRAGLRSWEVEVPMILIFTKAEIVRDYRFVANLRVKETGDPKTRFKIDGWFAKLHRGSMEPRYFKAKRPRKDYAYCYTLFPDDD